MTALEPGEAQGAPEARADAPLDDHVPPLRRFFQELWASPKGMTGFVCMAVIIIVAIFAPLLLPADPTEQIIKNRFMPPVFAGGEWPHFLGADNLGRDIFSRVILGTQTSVAVGAFVVMLALVVGSALGAIAGYFGGLVDSFIMRLTDFQLSFPFILLAIIFMAIFGPGFTSLVIALAVAIWVNYARLVRGETLKLRELEFIQAARSIGVRHSVIILRHVVPNVLPSIIVMATLDIAFVIIFEAALSFLGLGIQPPTPSWGVMISDGRNYMFESLWMTLGPGLAILVTAVAINLFGDFLRDTYDPRLAGL
ncbi:MAG: ABC transporter permease [Rhodospirillales bacterium]|nr:ABC transporter permease [Rhodospirillales bacterium]MDE0379327.1 ABC transporter permease [Rhodospirillales bacterium]